MGNKMSKILMSKEKFIELVTKALLNESTLEEKKQLYSLLQNDEYNNLFLWISENLNKSKVSSDQYEYSLDRGFSKLTEKIQKHEPSFTWKKDRPLIFKHHTSLLRIAASIILFVLVSFSSLYFLGLFEKEQYSISLNEKITNSGQKSILTLFDGTKITLNANSKLKYPTHFGEFSREIYLEGEAYFEVVHNSKKPFIVHTREISTCVLGTKFNVTAFPEDKCIEISLVEGKVIVSNNDRNDNSEETSLLPEQQYVYDKKEEEGLVRNFNVLEVIGWKNNTYVFENEPLKNVLVKLERAFGVKLEVKDKDVLDYKLKANFKNESFWAIIEAIKYATELDYKIVSKNDELEKVIFEKK
jgi:ferric-dicitrate binding protein FerR (iron transport regulator)